MWGISICYLVCTFKVDLSILPFVTNLLFFQNFLLVMLYGLIFLKWRLNVKMLDKMIKIRVLERRKVLSKAPHTSSLPCTWKQKHPEAEP